jgi:hypothetical protein
MIHAIAASSPPEHVVTDGQLRRSRAISRSSTASYLPHQHQRPAARLATLAWSALRPAAEQDNVRPLARDPRLRRPDRQPSGSGLITIPGPPRTDGRRPCDGCQS